MKGVGGMCLKVELVRGMPPAEPPINEADVDQKIAEKIKKIKKGKVCLLEDNDNKTQSRLKFLLNCHKSIKSQKLNFENLCLSKQRHYNHVIK